ncbi:MAG: cytidylate kinase family protein [Candidatus Marsarchaeota archaeon]|jgi:cytidylate kinase|nr:cytidylate kinase family protein [Candidatus Marsarchaeota archaeon]MCL5115001.1 cytidylate kinase family protein [Candidatus Marsarchaeota archaeon]
MLSERTSEKPKGIAISGLPVSGKSTLARMLADQFHLPVRSLGGLWRERWAKQYPNGEVSFEEYWRGTTVEDNLRINQEAKAEFESGNVIADSRFVSYLDINRVVRIFVDADLEIRAQRASTRADYSGKPIEEIRRILRDREQDELKMGRTLFKVDYRDRKLYHLVLNSGRMTPEQEMISVMALLEMRRD